MKTIIEMAREAGGYFAELPNGDAWLFDDEEQMERFAELVRAEAQADEREACARLAQNRMLADENKNKRIGHHHACKAIATDIRARGNT